MARLRRLVDEGIGRRRDEHGPIRDSAGARWHVAYPEIESRLYSGASGSHVSSGGKPMQRTLMYFCVLVILTPFLGAEAFEDLGIPTEPIPGIEAVRDERVKATFYFPR